VLIKRGVFGGRTCVFYTPVHGVCWSTVMFL